MQFFLFRPFCILEHPMRDCSDGWTLYQYVGLMMAIGYRRWEASVLMFLALIIAYYQFNFGSPGIEIGFHFLVGTLFGFLILKFTKPSPPLFVNYKDLTGIISFLIIIILGITSFANIDLRVTENNARYGVIGSFIVVVSWTLVSAFVLFRLNGVEKLAPHLKKAYWLLWERAGIAIILIMTIALIEIAGGYIKGIITLLLVPSILFLYASIK